MNIVLTGPMGSGKSSVGREVAAALGLKLADMDAIIESETQRTISEIFADGDEESFREIECELARRLAGMDGLVIATGGGVVLRPENMRRLRLSGIVIRLDAPAGVLLERVRGAGNRPVLEALGSSEAGLKKHLEDREQFYSICDHTIDTGKMSIEEVIVQVCRIASLPTFRICACISGDNPEKDVLHAARNGAAMVELRLDLIPEPAIESLVRGSPVPVIATDRADPQNLRNAISAGCEFIDIDFHCPEKDGIIRLASENGCSAIVSLHDFEGVPGSIPEKGAADFLKIAATLNSTDDLKKLVGLHGRRDDVIIAAMGPLGGLLRVFGPMLGSYLTYCYIGEPTATGQLELKAMMDIYRGMKLR